MLFDLLESAGQIIAALFVIAVVTAIVDAWLFIRRWWR